GQRVAHLRDEHGGLTVETDSELTVAAHRPEVTKGKHFVPFVNDGRAVQTGSELTVTVNRPTTNIVQIGSATAGAGAGKIRVEWNGGMVHTFLGGETLVVHTPHPPKTPLPP